MLGSDEAVLLLADNLHSHYHSCFLTHAARRSDESLSLINETLTVVDPGFLRGGDNPQNPLLFGQICMKMKEIAPRGGAFP